MNTEIITAQTAAVTTKAAFRIHKGNLPVTISTEGLAGSEEIDFYHRVNGSWELLKKDTAAVTFTASDMEPKTFYGPIEIGIMKDATVAAVGVFADTGR